jgi:hypothetical protein
VAEKRFTRPAREPEEAAERLDGEVRTARHRVFRSYVDARERGIELIHEHEPEPAAGTERDGEETRV